jgi:hypothetical protein
MITVITGLTGSGKTWYMTKLIHRDWKNGAKVFANMPLTFNKDNDDIFRWHNLDELYHLGRGVIAIDEGQKLFDARRWASLPVSFAEKIAQHRKDFLDIYTTTQDIGHIDVRIRQNIHELYNCQSLFRWPRNEREHPILQMVRITRKARQISSDTDRLNWKVVNRKIFFISRFFTKKLYDTYATIGMERYLCRIKREKKQWNAKIYSRDLVNSGKARL